MNAPAIGCHVWGEPGRDAVDCHIRNNRPHRSRWSIVAAIPMLHPRPPRTTPVVAMVPSEGAPLSLAPEFDHSHTSEWPFRLIEIAGRLAAAGRTAAETEADWATFWPLLKTVLAVKVRTESRRVGFITPEDAEDLASARTLELVRRLDQGKWEVAGVTPAQMNAFLTTVARNAVVDHQRRAGRWRQAPAETIDRESPAVRSSIPASRPADASILRREFVRALVACVRRLPAAHQRIWFLRVLLEMPSRQIASHPEVNLKVGNVDVIQQRCRQRISECIRTKGFEPNAMPAGTFTELWRTFRGSEDTSPGECAQ